MKHLRRLFYATSVAFVLYALLTLAQAAQDGGRAFTERTNATIELAGGN